MATNPHLKDIVSTNLGTPFTCHVEEIKTNMVTKYGTKVLITVTANGRPYEWWMTPPQFQRQFNGIVPGNWIEVVGTMGQRGVLMDAKKIATPPAAVSNAQQQSPTPVDDSVRNYEERQNRISISAVLVALIESGKYDVEAAKAMALELVAWTKDRAHEMFMEEFGE